MTANAANSSALVVQQADVNEVARHASGPRPTLIYGRHASRSGSVELADKAPVSERKTHTL